jgi:hypothetical protein
MRRPILACLLALDACAHGPPGVPGEPAIVPERARAGVAWLADPARTGRGVGTPGNAAAAEWIAGRLAEAGLVPAGEEGYLQPFEAPYEAVLRPGNALAIAGAAPVLGEGWQPFTFSDDGTAEGELVWVGYGITAPELGHDDYAGVEAKGKIVVVAQDFPREREKDSPFRSPRNYRYGEWRYKVTNAREHGAAGVLGVRDGWNHDGPDDLRPWKGTVSSRAGILAARVTEAALRAAGVDAAPLAAASAARPLGRTARLSVSIEQRRARTANVLALLPGADPAVAGECVVVGAHYDHLGLGGEESLAPEQTGVVHPGADDNASGTAALVEIAHALAAGPRPRRTVLLAAFGAEELGLLGSSQVVRSPPAACPVARMQLMLNLDMVGRPDRRKVYVDGTSTAKGLADLVRAQAALGGLRLDVALGGGDGYGPSDHTSFHARDVPVLYFFTGAHADYHRPSDTAEKVDAQGLAAVARLALRVARAAADAPARLEVVRSEARPDAVPRGERRGYGSYLGGIPDFGEREEAGVLLTGVRPGSPAERAGIAGGDVLLSVGGVELKSLEDLAFALRSHRPGDEVEVVWKRGEERITKTLRLEERK